MLPCIKAISGCFKAISGSYKATITSGPRTSVAGASVEQATKLPGSPVIEETIVVNLLLTDEEIEAKVAELIGREFRELIEASSIETNLRLREKPAAHLAS